MVKRCLFCGRFFNSEPRVKNQKACWRELCKKARKRLAQNNWCKMNPNYFRGRYWYIKEWRKIRKKKKLNRKKVDDTRRDTSKTSVFKITLLIPGMFKDKMIQDEILLKRVGRTTFFATGYRQ